MKKLQKFLTVLLCVCTLMGVMMPAASATTTLTIINLTLDVPVVGNKPTATASLPSHARSAVKEVEWSGELDSDGTFMAGVSYKVTVTLGIKKGEDCRFSDKRITAKVNSKEADEVYWYADDKVEVTYTFPELTAASAPTVLNGIHLTIDAPAGKGTRPAATASLPPNARSTVEKVEWSGQLDTDGTFMPRTRYKVTVTLGIKPGSNCIFSDKAINATVNGKEADEVLWYAEDKVTVSYTFPAYGTGTTLTSNWITMDGPAVGEKPATSAHLAATASTHVTDIRWEGKLDSNGRFQAGTEYTAHLTLRVKDEFKDRKFSSKSFDAYVNGVLMDEVTRVSDKEIIVSVEFEKTPGSAPSTVPETPETPVTGFRDVKASDYFAEPVVWAVSNNITSGTGNNQFSPNENCTQAQILTFLWRATGSPEPAGTMEAEGFSGTEYYYKAALWAAERGMIKEGGFDPEAPCTRAMAVTFMWNYAGSPANSLSSFTDVLAYADYAQAVAWAVKEEVTSGVGGNRFGPDETCTRGQIVTFLYRAFAK